MEKGRAVGALERGWVQQVHFVKKYIAARSS